jgi:hypothetical protein
MIADGASSRPSSPTILHDVSFFPRGVGGYAEARQSVIPKKDAVLTTGAGEGVD